MKKRNLNLDEHGFRDLVESLKFIPYLKFLINFSLRNDWQLRASDRGGLPPISIIKRNQSRKNRNWRKNFETK